MLKFLFVLSIGLTIASLIECRSRLATSKKYTIIGPNGIVIGLGKTLEERAAEIPASFLLAPPMTRNTVRANRVFTPLPVTDKLVTDNINLAVEAAENLRSGRCNRQLQLGVVSLARRENGEFGRSVFVQFTIRPLASIASQCRFDVNALPTCQAIIFVPFPNTGDFPGIDVIECDFFNFQRN